MRWQALGRWSVVGFAGTGAAALEVGQLSSTHSVQAGGVGFRYELARRFGIHAGMDVAWGPDETAIYFQTGSAWNRPLGASLRRGLARFARIAAGCGREPRGRMLAGGREVDHRPGRAHG